MGLFDSGDADKWRMGEAMNDDYIKRAMCDLVGSVAVMVMVFGMVLWWGVW